MRVVCLMVLLVVSPPLVAAGSIAEAAAASTRPAVAKTVKAKPKAKKTATVKRAAKTSRTAAKTRRVAARSVRKSPRAPAKVDPATEFIRTIDRMMIAMRPQSVRASALISSTYRSYLDLLVLRQFAALEESLSNGGLVPLPADPQRYNLKARVHGPSPIGEKDLDNQQSYISARPATIGALLDIASRVRSGPLEITSLARHSEYQNELRTTNKNAITSVPTHTMGLAFDIALINTPLDTIYEIRDVLRQMQEAGDILFIGERGQLVFHVVPHPSRLGYFNDVYAAAVASTMPVANVIASMPVAASLSELQPAVSAEVTGLRPTDDFAKEWWAAEGVGSDLAVRVSPSDATVIGAPDLGVSLVGRLAAQCARLMTGLIDTIRGFAG